MCNVTRKLGALVNQEEANHHDHDYGRKQPYPSDLAILYNAFQRACVVHEFDTINLESALINNHIFDYKISNTATKDPEIDVATTISEWNFQEDIVYADGNCVFYAISRNVRRILLSDMATADVYRHIGLNITMSENEMASRLRHLVCEEFSSQPLKYFNFLTETTEEMYLQMIDQMREDGFYESYLGDLVLLGMANVLHSSIIVFSSIHNQPVIAITPSVSSDTIVGNHFYITYHHAMSHFNNAIFSDSAESTNSTEEEGGKPLIRCRCGINNPASSKKSCINLKCKCCVNGIDCSMKCKCRCCGNNKEKEVVSKAKRVRNKHTYMGHRKRSEVTLKERGETVKRGQLNWIEQSILQELLSDLKESELEHVTERYNRLIAFLKGTVEVASSLNIQEATRRMITLFVKSYFAIQKLNFKK